ncbi:hypothetical protein [Streptomyces aureoversilis]|uniref:Transposase n=1 Tax=Streptomyces aureoversilis TaxID=67277 RepID=A0ABW0A7Q8_9ACTN
MRARALQDAEVHAVQERVDRLRIDYLCALWRELGGRPGIRCRAGGRPLLVIGVLSLVAARHGSPVRR